MYDRFMCALTNKIIANDLYNNLSTFCIKTFSPQYRRIKSVIKFAIIRSIAD